MPGETARDRLQKRHQQAHEKLRRVRERNAEHARAEADIVNAARYAQMAQSEAAAAEAPTPAGG